jgi:opacity protein-like surface antigen
MKTLVAAIAFLVLSASALFAADYVRPYYRSDGTYVEGHYRSSPDSNPRNNYSFPGNTNPYTGKVAPGNPDTYIDRYNNKPTSPYITPYNSPYRTK